MTKSIRPKAAGSMWFDLPMMAAGWECKPLGPGVHMETLGSPWPMAAPTPSMQVSTDTSDWDHFVGFRLVRDSE